MAGDEAVFFLAGQPRHLRVLPQRVYQQIIGQHVEFFLFFALHVAAARRTEHARKRAQPHQPADLYAGGNDGCRRFAQFGRQIMPAQVFG